NLTDLATPASQDFDAFVPQESIREDNPSLILDGITFSTDATDDALRLDTINNVSGNLPTLGTGNGLSSVWYGSNTGTYLQFSTQGARDDFRLVSLRAEVWSHESYN